ncbi:MAG: hypothetical protein JO250_04115 [Armatimonadetes bacterium]|nr:hypothetical protein [Armatimonadota bacterium]
MFSKVLQSKAHLLLLATCALWTAGIGVGFARLMDYATTAGDPGPAAGRWPAGTILPLDPDRPTLVLLAHPRCPCTSATMDELENLMARCRGLVALHVLFYRPGSAPADWAQTDLWRRAAAIPGAAVHADTDGAQARLFGATTSGQVLLYQPDGSLLFSGGITNTRGHAGPSIGADAVRSLLTKGTAPQAETPVYGCPLIGPRAPDRKGDQPCLQ